MKVNCGIDKNVLTFPLNITLYFDEGFYNIWIRISLSFLCFYLDFSFPYPEGETV